MCFSPPFKIVCHFNVSIIDVLSDVILHVNMLTCVINNVYWSLSSKPPYCLRK